MSGVWNVDIWVWISLYWGVGVGLVGVGLVDGLVGV